MYISPESISVFNEKLLLKDNLPSHIKSYLENPENTDDIPFEKKELYKALSQELEETLSKENDTLKEIELNKRIQKINIDLYKQAEKEILNKIKS